MLIEWGEKFARHLPSERVEIHLEYRGEQERWIQVVWTSDPVPTEK